MRLFLLAASLLTATLTYAQDNIILRNGEEIPAKVLEVNQSELKYRKSANLDGPVYTSSLRDVLLIKYANGTKDTFGNERPLFRNRPTRPAIAERDLTPALAPPASTAPGRSLDGLRYQRGLFSRYYVGGNGQHIGVSEANALFYSSPDAMAAYEKGRSLRTWSNVTGISALALIGTGMGLTIANRNDRRDGRPGANGFDDRRDGQRIGLVGGALAGSGVLLGVTSLWLSNRATVQFRRAASRYNNSQPTSLRFVPNQQGISVLLTF